MQLLICEDTTLSPYLNNLFLETYDVIEKSSEHWLSQIHLVNDAWIDIKEAVSKNNMFISLIMRAACDVQNIHFSEVFPLALSLEIMSLKNKSNNYSDYAWHLLSLCNDNAVVLLSKVFAELSLSLQKIESLSITTTDDLFLLYQLRGISLMRAALKSTSFSQSDELGYHLGMMNELTHDLLDFDTKEKIITMPNDGHRIQMVGYQKALEMIESHYNECKKILKNYGEKATALQEICMWVCFKGQ